MVDAEVILKCRLTVVSFRPIREVAEVREVGHAADGGDLLAGQCTKEARVAWYNNHYVCTECAAVWDSDWSCSSDDDCPECVARNISPISSEDLTVIVEPNVDGSWKIWRSPSEADEKPRYEIVGLLKVQKSGSLIFVANATAK